MGRKVPLWAVVHALLLGACGTVSVPDGSVATLITTPPENQRDKIVRIAATYIGDVETEGNNAGPIPRELLANVGINVPAPYCAAGIYTCYLRAGDTLRPKERFALAAAWNPVNRRIWGRSAASDTTKILPADVTGHDYGQGIHHTNLITKESGKYLEVIGFNTTDGFNRDGTGVYRKLILKSQVTCVSRWLPK
jgi:hypothetical protein